MRRLVICIVLLANGMVSRAADNELSPDEKRQGVKLLFDGKTAAGWLVNQSGGPLPIANVRDGMINVNKAGGSLIYTKERYGNFVLTCDFKVDERRGGTRCNSGVFFRVGDPKDEVQTGFEIQVYDTYDVARPGKNDSGALYDIMAPAKQAMKKPGEWNHLEITANKNVIKVMLNGESIIDCDLDKYPEPGKNADGSKNKYSKAIKDFPREGYIGLQNYSNDCWFKNIKVKVLK